MPSCLDIAKIEKKSFYTNNKVFPYIKVVQAMYKILSEPHEIYFQELLINKIHQLI